MYIMSKWELTMILAWLEISIVQSYSPRLAFAVMFLMLVYGRIKFYDNDKKGLHGVDLRSSSEIKDRKKELESDK